MENTCIEKECPWWKRYKTKCPNYMETWWTPQSIKGIGAKPELVKDCAPKRTTMMVIDLINEVGGLHAANNQARDSNAEMKGCMVYILKEMARAAGMQLSLDDTTFLKDLPKMPMKDQNNLIDDK